MSWQFNTGNEVHDFKMHSQMLLTTNNKVMIIMKFENFIYNQGCKK